MVRVPIMGRISDRRANHDGSMNLVVTIMRHGRIAARRRSIHLVAMMSMMSVMCDRRDRVPSVMGRRSVCFGGSNRSDANRGSNGQQTDSDDRTHG